MLYFSLFFFIHFVKYNFCYNFFLQCTAESGFHHRKRVAATCFTSVLYCINQGVTKFRFSSKRLSISLHLVGPTLAANPSAFFLHFIFANVYYTRRRRLKLLQRRPPLVRLCGSLSRSLASCDCLF
jgi:hypothetical protein